MPPQKPKILNERGEIIQTLAGPYDEGSDMVLLCEVRGGLPPPKIQWLWNGKSIDSTMLDFSFAGSQTSKLVIKNLSRIHQHSIVTCRASNFPKTETTANVTIDLLCKFVYGNQSIFFHFQYFFEIYLNFFNDFFCFFVYFIN